MLVLISVVAKVTKHYFNCNIIYRSQQSQGHVSGSQGNQAVFYL